MQQYAANRDSTVVQNIYTFPELDIAQLVGRPWFILV